MEIVSELSLVSAGEADVSSSISTVPEGALTPLKATCSVDDRLRLKTTTDIVDPLAKAND
jgi:hypothetical protein